MNAYSENRGKLINAMENRSISVLFSGAAPVKVGDESYSYTPERNFYYMTGIDRPNEILLLLKCDNSVTQILFIERYDDIKAKWVGEAIKPDECTKISAVTDIKYIDEFYSVLGELIFNKRIENIYLDLENRGFFRSSKAIELAQELKSAYPYLTIKNSYNIIAEFRRIKSDYEIENIKKAIEITGKGIKSMLKNAVAGMYEYQLEAYFDFALKANGVKDFAFKSIVAGGKNATILHYSENNNLIADNRLVLCDVGAAWNYYSGDITRTFPINGKFTERQKEIYNIVLDGQRLVIDSIRPGVEFASLNKILIEYYEKRLLEIGLIKDKAQVSDYYYHGVSHMLGLETHDAGRHNEGLLKEGMVLTVEPGLYIAEEGIGIRIEDDVVVTTDGCEIIYKDIPKTVEEIEEFMAGNVNG